MTINNPERFPLRQLPERPSGSIRRTTTLDCLPDGSWEAGALLTARGRDLVTGQDHLSEEVANHALALRLDASGRLTPAAGSHLDPQLIGHAAGRGFRHTLKTVFADAEESSLEEALLDDLPGMRIISGYARVHGTAGLTGSPEIPTTQIGVCHGWRSEGIAVSSGASLVDMLADRPLAPDLTGSDNGWHPDPPLGPDGMRRRRMLDVIPGDQTQVYAYFRDTHQQIDGPETVLHEYELRATISGDPPIVTMLEAVPGALPLSDCPGAAPGVVRVQQAALHDVEAAVRSRLAGTAGCTHLNDLVRALRFVAALSLACDTATGRRPRQTEGDRP